MALSLHAIDDATKVVLWQGEFPTEARLALHRTDSFEKLRDLIESGA
jgi:hypothetical protein